MRSLENSVPPPIVALIFWALMLSVSVYVPGIEAPGNWHVVMAAVVVALGAFVCLAGVISFRRASTTVNPLKPETASSLVVSGIYEYSRNPMYLGFALFLLAWAIYLVSPVALLGGRVRSVYEPVSDRSRGACFGVAVWIGVRRIQGACASLAMRPDKVIEATVPVLLIIIYLIMNRGEPLELQVAVATAVMVAFLVIYLWIPPQMGARSPYTGGLFGLVPAVSFGAILFPDWNEKFPAGVTRFLGWVGLLVVLSILCVMKIFIW